jgi:hypothetical protein
MVPLPVLHISRSSNDQFSWVQSSSNRWRRSNHIPAQRRTSVPECRYSEASESLCRPGLRVLPLQLLCVEKRLLSSHHGCRLALATDSSPKVGGDEDSGSAGPLIHICSATHLLMNHWTRAAVHLSSCYGRETTVQPDIITAWLTRRFAGLSEHLDTIE